MTNNGRRRISTHILARRMTKQPNDFRSIRRHFNSHPRKEDDSVHKLWLSGCYISTHILARRMTEKALQLAAQKCISTHILARRMTGCNFYHCHFQTYFNSHPRKEDDAFLQLNLYVYRHFNSHPRKEDDSNFKQK